MKITNSTWILADDKQLKSFEKDVFEVSIRAASVIELEWPLIH